MILNHGFTNIFISFLEFNTAGSNSQNCIINNLFFFCTANYFFKCNRFVWLGLVSFRFVCFAGLVQDKHGALFNYTIRATPTHANGKLQTKQSSPEKKRDFSPAKTESEKCELRVLRSDGWCLLALLTLNWWPSDRNWRKNVTSLHSQLEGIGWIEGISRSHRSSQPAENVKLVYQPTGKAALMSV